MRAVTFQAAGEVRVVDKPEPELATPGDAIVRISATGICGSDLHIYHGRMQIEPGFTIGHEYVGRSSRRATAVRSVAVGDRVLGCFQTACGTLLASAAAACFTSATARARSATARRSARCRARRPSRRSCPAPNLDAAQGARRACPTTSRCSRAT